MPEKVPRNGDPEGRRVARERAEMLSESLTIAHALKSLMRRASVDTAEVDQLTRDLKNQEQQARQKGYGQLESRKRFLRTTSHPQHLGRPRNLLFIDENGVHGNEPSPTYFTLGGVAMDEEHVDDYVVAANEIKSHFGLGVETTFHEPRMRDFRSPFDFPQDRRAEFDLAISELLQKQPITVFAVGIRKLALSQFVVREGLNPNLPTDMYSLAIMLLMERYVDYLASRGDDRTGYITFESLDPMQDAKHQLEFARILIDGTEWVPPSAFRSWLFTGLEFKPKLGSHPLEMADMVSRDMYEWIKSDCIGDPKRWDLFSSKAYCRGDGTVGKFGIKVFPNSDILGRTSIHRDRLAGGH